MVSGLRYAIALSNRLKYSNCIVNPSNTAEIYSCASVVTVKIHLIHHFDQEFVTIL